MGHFTTVNRHRLQVMKNCFRAGIPIRGLLHDLSKYSPTEFIAGARHYQGTRSPNEREREIYGYSRAWLHHKGRNRHHFEYWRDVNPATGTYEPVKMPIIFLAEMFCDRVAASKIYNGASYGDGDALEYFRKKKARDEMHPETAEKLEEWLVLLAEKGEKTAFSAVKKDVKNARLSSRGK